MQCEFRLIRYVPDVVRGEFATIGVVLGEAGRPETATVRMTRNWTRVRCLDADVDTAMLEAMEAEMAERLRMAETRPLLEILDDTLSNAVQLTEPRGCLAESLPAEMELLLRMYVEPERRVRERRTRGRAAIASVMRREFERAGVWALMRKGIAAEAYTGAGDPLRIDCGYRPNGTVRMFQAVALDEDLNAVKGLAFSATGLREGVRRLENAELELTAVVAPRSSLEDAAERYGFGVGLLESQRVRVMTTVDLPRMAETARRELRV